MKICDDCHNIVSDEDGLQLENRFYCKSGGCQKEYLDEVFEEQVVPDLMRTGTVVGYRGRKKNMLRGYHKGPAEFFKACEKCHKVQDAGGRYYYYYGYLGASPEGVTADQVVALRDTQYLLAGRESAFLCQRCANRPRWLNALWIFLPLLLAIIVFAGLVYTATIEFTEITCLTIGFVVIGYLILMRKFLRGKPDLPERVAIDLKKKSLQGKGFNVFLTETQFKKLY